MDININYEFEIEYGYLDMLPTETILRKLKSISIDGCIKDSFQSFSKNISIYSAFHIANSCHEKSYLRIKLLYDIFSIMSNYKLIRGDESIDGLSFENLADNKLFLLYESLYNKSQITLQLNKDPLEYFTKQQLFMIYIVTNQYKKLKEIIKKKRK